MAVEECRGKHHALVQRQKEKDIRHVLGAEIQLTLETHVDVNLLLSLLYSEGTAGFEGMNVFPGEGTGELLKDEVE